MIRCPKPALPYKCLCLGDRVRDDGRRVRDDGRRVRDDDRRVRGRGVILGDSCSCGDNTNSSVTRAVCCHRGVINIV